jgi:hypothetical protein
MRSIERGALDREHAFRAALSPEQDRQFLDYDWAATATHLVTEDRMAIALAAHLMALTRHIREHDCWKGCDLDTR